ncbi:MAG: S8 family serine peptidase [Marinifilaceae bacterium]
MRIIILSLFTFLTLSCAKESEWNIASNNSLTNQFDTNYFVPGVVRIQFKEQPNLTRFSEVATRCASKKEIVVKDIKPVFQIGGRFEKRQRDYGLDKWYDVILCSADEQHTRSVQQFLISEQDITKAYIIPKIEFYGDNATYTYYNDSQTNILNKINDPFFSKQWSLCDGDEVTAPNAHINISEAWKHTFGSPEVIVAINDTGVDLAHEDLVDNLWVNTAEIPNNGIDDDGNGYVDDIHGVNTVTFGDIVPGRHGTHVAGTVAATTNNGKGVAGVAGGSGNGDGIRLMCLEASGGLTATAMCNAFIYAADHGAVISQNSWGYKQMGYCDPALIRAMDYFIANAGCDENGNQTGPMKGGIIVCSAGNENTYGSHYPSAYEPCISVGSTDIERKKSSFSNFDVSVDLCAPGGTIFTTTATTGNILSTLPNNQYGYMAGTSMACPHVSGIVALVVSKFGGAGFTNELCTYRVLNAVNSLYDTEPNHARYLGGGLIDAGMALRDYDNILPAPKIKNVVRNNEGITISWDRVVTDGGHPAVKYYIYHASQTLTENVLNKLDPIVYVVSDKNAMSLAYTFANLESSTEYYFKIVAEDGYGNKSELSEEISYLPISSNGILAFPQKVTTTTKITWGNDFQGVVVLNVFSMNGQKVYTKDVSELSNVLDANLSFLAPGRYRIEISNGQYTGACQIIKM